MKCIRKIALMHRMFGRCEGHTCGECSNLEEKLWDRVYRKCMVYGDSNSEASDWAKKWEACGMFNKEYSGGPVMALVRPGRADKGPIQPLDGQMEMEGM